MATTNITARIKTVFNRRRLDHMIAHAKAKIRRCPKRERAALVDRLVRDMTAACVRVEIEQ